MLMAGQTSKRWVAVRWASGTLLLLVPVLAICLFGSDCLGLNRTFGAGLVDANAFAPQAKPKAKAAPANGEVLDVHLDVWENTANRITIQQ
jgi:hypothetical protein